MVQRDPYGIQEIIQAIMSSGLSEGKKLAYLYMIASGTFSHQCLYDLEGEIGKIGEKLQKEHAKEKAEIAGIEEQIKALDLEMDDLAVKAAQEMQSDVDVIVQYADRQAEKKAGEGEQSKLKAVYKKLKKTKV